MPSVIFGLIGIFVLVPLLNKIVPPVTDHLQFLPIFKGSFYGVSYLTAGIVLAIMIVAVHRIDLARGADVGPDGAA